MSNPDPQDESSKRIVQRKGRLPLGYDKLVKKLGGFVRRTEGEVMAKFKAIGTTEVEYETESGKTGHAVLYRDSSKKWRFRRKNQ